LPACWRPELDLDVMDAKRAGLLHDIGKAVDFEMEGTHVELGSEIARRYKLDSTVINSIESHHDDVEPRSLVASLVAAADAISAARPGARRENIETYIKRIEKLEELAQSVPGVEKSYAVQAGDAKFASWYYRTVSLMRRCRCSYMNSAKPSSANCIIPVRSRST